MPAILKWLLFSTWRAAAPRWTGRAGTLVVSSLAVAALLGAGCLSPPLNRPGMETNPPKGRGIWTLERANIVVAVNRRQEHFTRDEVVTAIIYGYGGTRVVIELLDLDGGLLQRDEHDIPPANTIYQVYRYLPNGRYKVQMIIQGTLADQFYFTVDRTGSRSLFPGNF